MIEVLKQAYQLLLTEPHAPTVCDQLEVIFRQAISELEQRSIAELESQEPVAWLEPEWREKICPEVGYEVTMTDDHPRDLCWIPLYATPPTAQRTWVGLTDEEIEQGYETTGHYQTLRPQDRFAVYALARAIEAKLKEKNT
jgi:hypothetical protein